MSRRVPEVILQRERSTDATDLFGLPAIGLIQINVEHTLEVLSMRLAEIESDVERLKAYAGSENERKLRMQNDVIKSLNERLTQDFKDKYVAISYDGRVIASADTDIELLKQIQESGCVADEVFLHRVGSPAFAGWT